MKTGFCQLTIGVVFLLQTVRFPANARDIFPENRQGPPCPFQLARIQFGAENVKKMLEVAERTELGWKHPLVGMRVHLERKYLMAERDWNYVIDLLAVRLASVKDAEYVGQIIFEVEHSYPELLQTLFPFL